MKKERRDVFYAWHHKETGERLGWTFPSRKAAKAWMEENYWRYPKYGRLDDYLETLRSIPVMKFSRKYWYRDRNVRVNYELLMGVLTYPKLIAGRMAPFEITYLTAKAGTRRKLNGDSRGRKKATKFKDGA
jgi:hypothetical protein